VKVTKQALVNFSNFSEGKYQPELGIEHFFNPPEKIEEVKKEPVAKKGAKDTVPVIADTNKEQRQKELQEFLLRWEFRNTLGPFFWLKLKQRLSELLYFQSRYVEAQAYAQSLRQEASRINEDFFERTSFEIEAYVMVRLGKVDSAIDLFEKMRSLGERNFYADPEFCIGLSNYASFLQERGHFAPALEVASLAREKIRAYLEKNGFVNKPVDINKDILIKQVLITRPAKEEVKVIDPKDKRSKTPDKIEKSFKEEIISAGVESEANSGLIPLNLYVAFLEVAVKIEMLHVECAFNEDFSMNRTAQVLEMVLEVEEIAAKTLHINPSVLINIQTWKGRIYRIKFIKCLKEFQEVYVEKSKEKRKYKKITEKFPDYGLGSGKSLLHLPNFSHKLQEDWLPLLDRSKESLEKSIQLSMKESIFSGPHQVFIELYQVLQLQREYRVRVGYKYLSNPGEATRDEASYEDQLKQESGKVHKVTKEMLKALQVLTELFNTRENVRHQFSQFSTALITDINKIPRMISTEILETDYLQKKKYATGLFEESKKKVTINALDCFTYLLKHFLDLNALSFGREWRESRVLKLHRVLLVVCAQYAAKCKFVWDLVVQPSPTEELVPLGTVLGFWEKKRADNGEVMQFLNYLCAPMDANALVIREVEDNEPVVEFSKKDLFLYGEVRVNEFALSNLAQALKDLKEKVRKSAGFAKEKCERDFRRYAEELKKILFEVATWFDPELNALNKDNNQIKKESAQKMIAALLPQINEEKVNNFANAFWIGGFSFKDANTSAIFRGFHSLRYKG
jgi:tetratricopeptide (TPR) repeat protein